MGTACGGTHLDLEIYEICGTLEKQNKHSQITCVLAELLTSALTLALHLLERREHHAKKLYHDGCSDVRHDTEGKDGCLGERTAREHVEQLHETALVGEVGQGIEVLRRDAWENHVTAESVNEHQHKGHKNALPELLNGPNVTDCLNKSHCEGKGY